MREKFGGEFQNLANFTKSPNCICQTVCNSSTIIPSPMFSPNFSLTNLVSYTVTAQMIHRNNVQSLVYACVYMLYVLLECLLSPIQDATKSKQFLPFLQRSGKTTAVVEVISNKS